MYNSNEVDTKYTVADILSSMANGVGNASTPTSYSTPSLSDSTILTPTTLQSIEQSFMQLQSQQVMTVMPGSQQTNITQSGFVPPQVGPIVMEASMNQQPAEYRHWENQVVGESADDDDSDSDWIPPNVKRQRVDGAYKGTASSSNSRGAGRRPTGPRRQKFEKLTPEEEQRRRVRRERNKVAAAKCRQRRVDQTNTLQAETEELEEERGKLEHTIQTLQQQKEQLEFLLEAHKPMCSVKSTQTGGLLPPSSQSVTEAVGKLIKIEPPSEVKTETVDSTALTRPTSLALNEREASMTAATGIAINTPSVAINTPSTIYSSLSLDTLVDHTGLTPLTGVSATSIGGTTPTCSTDLKRSRESSNGGTMSSPTTLMAL